MWRTGADISAAYTAKETYRLVSFDPGVECSHLWLRVTGTESFGAGANPNLFDEIDDKADAVSVHRERIIELREEVSARNEALTTMPEIRNMYSSHIWKNTADIGLACAFLPSGLNHRESSRPRGGAGCFLEESVVAFGFTGRLSQNVAASGGVKLADDAIDSGYGCQSAGEGRPLPLGAVPRIRTIPASPAGRFP